MNGVSIKSFYRFCLQTQYEWKRSLDTLAKLLATVPQPENLLDVGCGDGIKTAMFADMLAVPTNKVYGIELKDNYVAQVKNKLNVKKIDLEKDLFPFDDQEIDTIICNQVLEHLKNIFQPLSEIDRVIKKGGHLVIGIPNLAALHNRILMLLGRQPMCNEIKGPHVRCFTHQGFLRFLRENQNFRLLSVKGATIYPFPYPFVSVLARYFPGISAYTFYLLQKIRHAPQACGWSMPEEVDTCF